MRARRLRGYWMLSVLAAICIGTTVPAAAQIRITLRRSFIQHFKNRVTIDATFTVDKAHAKPNRPSKDGDLHVAGRSPQIELPVVAEIMNAAGDTAAVNAIHAAEGTGEPLTITGAWRIWCEHGGSDAQVQDRPLQAFTTTNPSHVFEIHPIASIGDHSTSADWIPIAGYEPKKAEDAFDRYETKTSRIAVTDSTVTITTSGVGYNYVRFKIVLNGTPWHGPDGYFVLAQVLTLDDELLVRNRRMVFADSTPPALKVSGMAAGDTLEVLGIPRVDLAIVSWRAQHATDRPEALTWNLPYEMIIVGTYDTSPES